ncbi:MAG: hypothetical protein Q7T69_14835 [Rhodoferax sp.]|nr:hypothetical protein [Rhodoferax sp.]
MKAAFKANSLAVGVLLLCTAMGSAAMGLGRAQGAVFVGQPLDVRVQLLLDASEDIQSVCMGAEVFYGETPLDAARVSVAVEPAAPGSPRGATVRVTASTLIDEPIVTINLRAGCAQKSSKRYTLFPEVSTHVVEPVVAPLAARRAGSAVDLPVVAAAGAKPQPAPATPAPAPAPDGLAVAAPKKPRRAAVSESAVAKAAPPAQVSAPAAAPVAPVARAKPAKAAGKSRLKLDPLDLLVEVDPVLRATTELLALPQENPEKRAEAAAQWAALNATPETMLRDAAQAQSMEKDLKSLYAVTAENQKGLMELVAKVQRAESERYANGLVYTLMALCLASMLGLAWAWRRSRVAQVPSWQRGWDAGDSLLSDQMRDPERAPVSVAPAPAPSPTPAAVAVAVAEQEPEPKRTPDVAPDLALAGSIADLAELDFDLDLMEAPSVPAALASAHRPPANASSRSPARDFSDSRSGGLRSVDSADLLDVRQQAEFFVSLGEHQKAIDLLTTRIAQCGESSPLVCLDLLKIYHALGRESEFEFMRTEFNAWFTGHVPPFADFGQEGHSLEHYPQILKQIVGMWPDASVLEYIESCIYHHATDTDGPTFDLQAYRDLLLLHAVAKRIVRGPDSGGDSSAAELMRIPAQAPAPLPGEDAHPVVGSAIVHRAGAEHRGAWKRSPTADTNDDPELELETRGTPLGAMKVPPVVAPPPEDLTLARKPEPGRGPETDFDFLSLR